MARSSRALVVELVADVKDFVKGTQQADQALDRFVRGTEGDFDQMARESKTATDKMERNFDNFAREAKRSFDKVERDARDVDMAGAKQSFGEAGSEVGSEFAQNLGESLSSGDLTALAQDTAGGLIGAFQGIGGPIGVGLAGAAAVATTVFAKMAAEAQASAERIRTLTGAIFDELNKDMGEALSQFTRSAAFQEFQASFSKSGDLNEGMKELRRLADQAGVSVGEIGAAFIQGGPAAENLRAKLAAAGREGQGAVKNVRGVAVESSNAAKAANTLADRFREADVATANAAANLADQYATMIALTAQARQLDRNLAAVARNSAKTAENLRAAAGQSIGGRALL